MDRSAGGGVTFFDALLDGLPQGHAAALWSKSGGSRYPLTAANAEREVHGKVDVYVAVGFLAPGVGKSIGAKGRPSAAQIGGVYGLWLDLDVNGTPDGRGGAKTGAAPDLDAALALARALAEPTMIVNSGGGVHAWWLLREPWAFKDNGEREQAASLAHRWQDAHRREVTWGIDSTHDLARLLRPPETTNGKSTPPVPVTLIAAEGSRYDRAALEAFVKDIPVAQSPQPVLHAEIDHNASVPHDKLEVLCENDSKFRATWERQRTEFGDDDSKYDLALATRALSGGFSESQAVALMREFRSRNDPSDTKVDRDDYYARTIAKAQNGAGHAEQADGPEPFFFQTKQYDAGVAYLNAILPKAKIRELRRYDEDKPTITAVLNDGTAAGREIVLGTEAQLTSYQGRTRIEGKLRFALQGRGKVDIPKSEWPEVQRALATARYVTRGTDKDRTLGWLQSFVHGALDGGSDVAFEDLDDAETRASLIDSRARGFFDQDGRLWVLREALETHLRRFLHLKLEDGDLARRLKALGFTRDDSTRVEQRDGGRVRKSPRYWRSEAGMKDRIADA